MDGDGVERENALDHVSTWRSLFCGGWVIK